MRSRDDYYTYSLRGKDGLIHIVHSSDYFIAGCVVASYLKCDGGHLPREIVKERPNCLACIADAPP